MTSITPITTILQEMRFAAAQAEQARGKSVVVFLGNTGSGKSTTINYLAGLPMYYGTGGIDVSPPREPIAPIGHGTISRTRFTSVYPIEEEVVEEGAARRKWHFVDTGGFLDTRGEEASVVVPFSTKCTLQNAREVKVVLCADISLLRVDRGVHLTELFRTAVGRLVGDGIEHLARSFFFLITKAEPIPNGEGATVDPTNELVKVALRVLRASTPHSSLEERIYDLILRDSGKFIKIVNPLDEGVSRRQILAHLDEMPWISNEVNCFRSIPYSAETRLWLGTTMKATANEGREMYGSLVECDTGIGLLQSELATLTQKIEFLQQRICLLGDSDPAVVQQTKGEIIASTTEQIAVHVARRVVLQERIEKENKERIELEKDAKNLQEEGDKEQEYKSWSLIRPAVITEDRIVEVEEDINLGHILEGVQAGATTGGEAIGSVARIIGVSGAVIGSSIGRILGGILGGMASLFDREKRTFTIPGVRLPVVGNFYYQGPSIARLTLDPHDRSPCWVERRGSVGDKEYEVKYQSEPGEPGCASIRVFVRFRDLPSTLLEQARLTDEVAQKQIILATISTDSARNEWEIERFQSIARLAQEEGCRVHELEKEITELRQVGNKCREKISDLQETKRQTLADLITKEESFVQLDRYLRESRDDELRRDSVVRKYLAIREAYQALLVVS